MASKGSVDDVLVLLDKLDEGVKRKNQPGT